MDIKEFKAYKNEGWEAFCIRILSKPEKYGLSLEQAFLKLFGKNLQEKTIKDRIYLAKNINNAKLEGRHIEFIGGNEYNKDTNLDKISNDLDDAYDKIDVLEYSKQRLMDENRILRKKNRSVYRYHETYEQFLKSLEEIIEKNSKPIFPAYEKIDGDKNVVALMQLSDWHIGQLVNLHKNKYDVEIARERIFKYLNYCINDFESKNIQNVVITLLGDLLNLDERQDQLLTNQFVRAEAFLYAYDILVDFIDILVFRGYNVSIAGVVGNESRMKGHEFFSSVDEVAKDNLDYVLYNLLMRRYKDMVHFLNHSDTLESLININGKNILLTHGNNLNHSTLFESVNKTRQRYYDDYKIFPDYVLLGHIHHPHIDSTFARNASIVGANPYSSNKLNIPFSHVSQNLHYIYKDRIVSSIIECE